MQREKLYNLYRTVYFIVALLAFIMSKILNDQFSTVRKRYCVVQDEFIFSHFIVLSPNIFYLKKRNTSQAAA